ncbi:MAG: hypothetical protein WCP46_07050 [Alphaproteobacteria bacterium]
MLLYNRVVNNESQNHQSNVPPAGFEYNSGNVSVAQQIETAHSQNEVRWKASEFISHEKNSSWYFILALVTVALCLVVFILTHQYISVGVIVVMAAAFGVYANIKPKTLEYLIDSSGVTVDKKHFSYENFKIVEIVEGGMVPSVNLIPVKRFSVPVTLYFSPQQENQILEILGEFLPSEIKRLEAIDRIVAKLHF